MNKDRLLGSDVFVGRILAEYLDFFSVNDGTFCSINQIARNVLYRTPNLESIKISKSDRELVVVQIKNCRALLKSANTGFSIYNLSQRSQYMFCRTLEIGTEINLPFKREKWMKMYDQRFQNKFTGGVVTKEDTIKPVLTTSEFITFAQISSVSRVNHSISAKDLAYMQYGVATESEIASIRNNIMWIRRKLCVDGTTGVILESSKKNGYKFIVS